MFGDSTIKTRVMARVNAKIAASQKRYDDGVTKIASEADADADAERQRISAKEELDRERLADSLVDEIFGNV